MPTRRICKIGIPNKDINDAIGCGTRDTTFFVHSMAICKKHTCIFMSLSENGEIEVSDPEHKNRYMQVSSIA